MSAARRVGTRLVRVSTAANITLEEVQRLHAAVERAPDGEPSWWREHGAGFVFLVALVGVLTVAAAWSIGQNDWLGL